MVQFQKEQPWTVVNPDGGNAGGHSFPLLGYNSTDAVGITWGQTQELSWPWFLKYSDEAYCVITEDFIDQVTQKTIDGFDLEQLKEDIIGLSGHRTESEINKEESTRLEIGTEPKSPETTPVEYKENYEEIEVIR
jgi:hypothetical protein